MSVDRRTRQDGAIPPVDPADFFGREFPDRVGRQGASLLVGASRLRLRPLTVEVDGAAWTLMRDSAVRVGRGAASDAAHVRIPGDIFTALVNDQTTPIAFHAAGTLDMPCGTLHDLLDWWLVLRAVIDDRPLYTPGSVSLADPAGRPLDLHRSFTPGDPEAEMATFLATAGYLHIAAVFSADEMAEIATDMDRAASRYTDGDGRSWWATTADGRRRLVRMQAFDRHSPAVARLLSDDRLARIGNLPGDGHVPAGMVGNRIEALIKPIDVTAGISDVPWHKDCSLGRHSYDCCSLTVGISVTGADRRSGQLRVVAGSHRALLWPARLQPGHHDLPEIDLPTRTGSVTVHLSCTLHMAQPPIERERRVLYTSFRLPELQPAAAAAARARLLAVRERAPVTVSQQPAGADRRT